MTRKVLFAVLIAAILITSVMPAAAGAAVTKTPEFDLENVSQGVVGVTANRTATTGLKVRISHTASGQYRDYDLGLQGTEYYPLQLGNGAYTVSVFERTTGNSYRRIAGTSLELKLQDANQVYLSSMQLVNWNSEMAVARKARELTAGKTTDLEKVRAIHTYLVKNYKYDFNKAATVKSGYVPDVEKIDEMGLGICYDYSAVMAAMLRSLGIPAKLVKGYTTNFDGYHAWNEVLVEGRGWVTIDSTVDSYYAAYGKAYNMIKPAAQYNGTLQF